MASTSEAPTAAWEPTPEVVEHANLAAFMRRVGAGSYEELHRWSVEHRSEFWQAVIDELGIVFRTPPHEFLARGDVEDPGWLEGARLNVVESALRGPAEAPAIVSGRSGSIEITSRGQLQQFVAEAAGGLRRLGVGRGDRVAIAMPMNLEAVVAYLAVVAIGAVVVSIADSFAADEIATRLRITDTDLVVTQDRILRGGRELPMFDKVVDAGARRTIVVSTGGDPALREGDLRWDELLVWGAEFEAVAMPPDAPTNILFSSGTTGEPKAIPWTQLTPIKAAMDGRFHQDIHPDDRVAWPTNLGWMMGPWLIYASLVNGAAMALYDDAPNTRGFTEFVQDAGVTVLGLVPSLVAAWRSTGALDGVDWTGIRLFSSTGEASNPDDMRWLMAQAGGRPVIEYCGGTEIGGGYITGTVLQPAVPAAFSTPALGLDVRILDDDGRPAREGELFIVPPSIGLSTTLLNRDHHEVYYAGVPEADVPLRRHGDHMEHLGGGYYRALGRVDDTMNLGGIKVSSAEIERVAGRIEGVREVAAIAVAPPGGGPARLVIYAVPESSSKPDPARWREEMQAAIKQELNPLFKIADVVAVDALPRTASAKVMRRELRRRYESGD